ncbi:MAG: 3-phosphoshikimate 1-carboxyvinyltransferase [Bacteroides sp.]|nr:3-phosphoshikimate 1-carboxyvinyltransferase [Prevotella sp.]MCM1407498.1 3-phosphoshikimate 1-carboxyvinyltransferase [Treponema brennaborense]MCM1469988.1 3-phosphoshikimate 1-carboxyvinyltransferase [Bacteroides sp.]
MNISAQRTQLSGRIGVPGSKSHTIRALLLAALADGVSHIRNPLPSADCLSAARAVAAFGADIDIGCPFAENGKPAGTPNGVWTVIGARQNMHLPSKEIDVGNSGSTMYFFAPVAAAFSGVSRFTGDKSICSRPVGHLLDALRQLGAEASSVRENTNTPPFFVSGPIHAGTIHTDGRLSQYISGFMMASLCVDGKIDMFLSDPKETPYLAMTKQWLESVGVPVEMSADFRHIAVCGRRSIAAFDRTIPADWEAVAFPLAAALISGSDLVIDDIDCSGSQGDEAVVRVLQNLGADIAIEKKSPVQGTLIVKGSSSRLAAPVPQRIPVSDFPDAICALAAVSCFAEGTVILDDTAVCRRKETDRVQALVSELRKLGADAADGLTLPEDDPLYGDCLIIRGHNPLCADGSANPQFTLHGGTAESFDDHRIAMALACLGLGLPSGETLIVKDAECCAVSFPRFFEKMNAVGANFTEA